MQKVFKEEQIEVVARKLNLAKVVVKCVVEEYIQMLLNDLSEGRTIKVFNICHLRVKYSEDLLERKTLAYISTEIGRKHAIGGVTVQRILSSFEDQIVKDLKSGRGFTLRGLIRISPPSDNGITRLELRKATCFNSAPVYVSTLGSFRRRVLSGG